MMDQQVGSQGCWSCPCPERVHTLVTLAPAFTCWSSFQLLYAFPDMARSTPAAAGARPLFRLSRSWLTRRSAIGHCQFDCQRRQPPPPCAYKPSSRSVLSLPHTIIILASMIFTSIIIAFVFALAGVFQDPITDNLLFSLTILTLPSLSAVSNILHIAG